MVSFITLIYSTALIFCLWYTVKKSLASISLKKSLITWGLFGFISTCIILGTYYAALPLPGISPFVGGTIVTLVLFILSVCIGLPYLLVGCVTWYFRKNVVFNFVTLVSAFTLVEILRPYLFTIITWGGGSMFGSNGSSWAIGSILTMTPLLVFARLGGAVALGTVLIYLVGLLVYPLSKTIKLCGLILLVIFYVLLRASISPPTSNTPPIVFGIVQTAFPHVSEQEDVDVVSKERIVSTLHPLVMSLASSSPQLVVLPEDLRYFDLQTKLERQELLHAFPNTIFADASTHITSSGRKNISIVYDTQTHQEFTRNKGFMFPFGEYIPYAIKPVIEFFIGEEILHDYEAMYEYTPGENPSAFTTKIGNIGVLICSESTSYSALESLKRSNPDIIIVQSSLSWFHGSPYYTMGYLTSLKLLAVMTARPVLAVEYDGPSIMLDANGKIISFENNSFATHLYSLTGTTITKIK